MWRAWRGDTATPSPRSGTTAPTFYFTNPYAVIGAHDDVPVPPGCRALRLRTRSRRRHRQGGPRPEPRAGPRPHHRLHDPQRLVRPRPAGPARCGSDWARPRARTPPPPSAPGWSPPTNSNPTARRRLPRPPTSPSRSTARPSARTRLANMAWTFEEMVGLRLPRHLGPPRRRPGLRHLRQRRLPGRTLGPQRCVSNRHRWRPGDTVTMTVQGIGTISNTVVEGVPPIPITPARRKL